MARQERPGPIEITSQQSRFTDGLVQKLRRAYALDPANRRFVDFDLFSGTQALIAANIPLHLIKPAASA